MDAELETAAASIVGSETPATWLKLADDYIEMFNKNAAAFRLPKDHIRLKPVLENFAYDLAGFVQFVKVVRDDLQGARRQEVHEVYRKIMGRMVQQDRRRRLNAGVTLIEQTICKRFTQAQKISVAAWLEQYWGRERLNRLDEARAEQRVDRLSTDVRADVCDAFWAEVDKALEDGIVPVPPEIVYERSESPRMESHKPDGI